MGSSAGAAHLRNYIEDVQSQS